MTIKEYREFFSMTKKEIDIMDRSMCHVGGFAYSPPKQVDGIVVCHCPIPLGGQCSYHFKVIDLKFYYKPWKKNNNNQ